MGFRKIVLMIPFFLSVNFVSGQEDTTAFVILNEDTSGTENYFIENFDAYTSLDSLSSGDEDLYTIYVSFDIKDSVNLANVYIEVALISADNISVLYSANYNYQVIHTNYLLMSGGIEIPFNPVVGDNTFKITIMISSDEGMTDRVLTKTISI